LFYVDRRNGRGVELYKLYGDRYLLATTEPRFLTAEDVSLHYIECSDRRTSFRRRKARRDSSHRRLRDRETPGVAFNRAVTTEGIEQNMATLHRVRTSGEHGRPSGEHAA